MIESNGISKSMTTPDSTLAGEKVSKVISSIEKLMSVIILRESGQWLQHSQSDFEKSLGNPHEKLREAIQQFGSLWNAQSAHFAPLSREHRHRLETILQGFSNKLHPFNCQKQLILLKHTFKKLMRHLLQPCRKLEAHCLKPSHFFGRRRTFQPLTPQLEVLTPAQQGQSQAFTNYFKDPRSELPPLARQLVALLSDRDEELELTSQNGRRVLNCLKIFDLALSAFNRTAAQKIHFPKTSFELRARILKMCSPWMSTSEAFTITLDPRRYNDRAYLCNPRHWIPERVAQHATLISNQLVKAIALSARLNHYLPAIWAVRGNTGVGKGWVMAEDPYFSLALDEEGCISGALNPDYFKLHLRALQGGFSGSFLVNNQVHLEGPLLLSWLMASLEVEATHASLLIDRRHSTIEEIRLGILEQVKKRGGEALLIDTQAPLITSLFRVLERDPFTHQCPPLLDIIKGYKESIIYLKKLLQVVREEPSLKYFKQYFVDEQGVKHLVAEKNGGALEIPSQALLQKCCQLPSDDQIEALLARPLTEGDVRQAIQRGDIPESSAPRLLAWVGVPLSRAIEKHARGQPAAQAVESIKLESYWHRFYGTYKREPFVGAWLSDLQSVLDHIQSEQLLHVRGVDDEGAGLHWETNKFGWKLNPAFNPEAKACVEVDGRGGFQMRLGYFIVPTDKADVIALPCLSPKIRQELEERDSSGHLLGYRFFVHPEGYTHFLPLHAAGVPFVQPENSAYMGAPTSSYRSWIIRRVSDDGSTGAPSSVPFIAKLGVAGAPGDVRRLLPRSTIEHSLEAQTHFNKVLDAQGDTKGAFICFPENFGLSLKNVTNYPPTADISEDGEPVDSGMLIRKFPKKLLAGKCKIISLSAVMSVERTRKENVGLCALSQGDVGTAALPLIYEIIQAAKEMQPGLSTTEFIRQYFIDGYLKAVEPLHLQAGISLAPHGQNLCLVLNADNSIRGFAYRDMEAVSKTPPEGFLETYSWFYRYHNLIKLLNVLTLVETAIKPLSGKPTQLGSVGDERLLYPYIHKSTSLHSAKIQAFALGALYQHHISPGQYKEMLKRLDKSFKRLLKPYFNLKAAAIMQPDGSFPAAEPGSAGAYTMAECNTRLWQNRYPVKRSPSKKSKPMALFEMPGRGFLEKIQWSKLSSELPDLMPSLHKSKRLAPQLPSDPLQIQALPSLKEIGKWHDAIPEVPASIKNVTEEAPRFNCLSDLRFKSWRYNSLKEIPKHQLAKELAAAIHGDLLLMQEVLSKHPRGTSALLEDALFLACSEGHLPVASALLEKGVNPAPIRNVDPTGIYYYLRWTPLGVAISKRRTNVVKKLLQHGCSVHFTSHIKQDKSALQLYFDGHAAKGSNLELLTMLLEASPAAQIDGDMLFPIAVYSSSTELKALLSRGVLSPNAMWIARYSKASLLDFTVWQAEKASLSDNQVALEKVSLLLEAGADATRCHPVTKQNYLHYVTDPTLRKMLCQSGVNAAAEAAADRYMMDGSFARPIDLASTQEAVEQLCSHGELRENAPFHVESRAWKNALQRLGVEDPQSINMTHLKKALQSRDFGAFTAMIAVGVDLNQTGVKGGWTLLHDLFASIRYETNSDEYDLMHWHEDTTLRLIYFMIKNGAKPLKDAIGRTPLMCLPFPPRCSAKLIDDFVPFEAAYYGIPEKEYGNKLHSLRSGGFWTEESFYGYYSAPQKPIFDDFWRSLQSLATFDPEPSHDPTADWSKMVAEMKK